MRHVTVFNTVPKAVIIKLQGFVLCSHKNLKHSLFQNVHITVLLTKRRSVSYEKLAGPKLVEELPVLYGTRMFLTVFTGAIKINSLLTKPNRL